MPSLGTNAVATKTNGAHADEKKRAAMSGSAALSRQAVFYMCLLSLQFGMQPSLTRRFTPPTVCRSSVVMIQEVTKFFIGLTMLTSQRQLRTALKGWSIGSWWSVALVPAALYSVQNISSLLAYQNLDALTFNVLNQTKTLSAALCCYLVIGRKQSRIQILALLLLLTSALIMEKMISMDLLRRILIRPFSTDPIGDEEMMSSNTDSQFGARHFTHGVVPVLLASFLSGLAGALSQKNLQSASGCGSSGGRNAYLFSMELCVASILLFGASFLTTEDGALIRKYGFFHNWTLPTMIPIATSAAGGILVGLVTKYAGSVRKGFALIFGILLSGLFQAATNPDDVISTEQIIGGLVAAISLWMHATHPYTPPPTTATSIPSSTNITHNNSATTPSKRTRKSRKED
jgi:UDP-sugar transporter A1/2/3